MAKQIKVKDIAQMAGISAGTVDRVLHKRGNVSEKSREAVEKVLAQVGYKYNIHTSAISYRKKIKFVITIPEAEEGEYWGAIRNGLNHALEEFSDIETECNFLFYDQFNVDSCTHAFSQVLDSRPDAVIIGPTYIDETCLSFERITVSSGTKGAQLLLSVAELLPFVDAKTASLTQQSL